MKVSYLLVEEDSSKEVKDVYDMEEEEDTKGPYEEIEELMKPKVEMSVK